jgi:uncharacterized repeat protein (TIGR03943 family)
MTEEAAAGVVAVLGVLILRLTTSGRFVDYVRPRMGPLLTGAAVVLMVAGALRFVGLLRSRRGTSEGTGERSTSPVGRAGLLLIIPIVLLATVPVAPLGAFAAGLRATTGRSPPASSFFAPMAPPVRGAVALTVSDFISRALYDPGASLRGVTVLMIGFAAPDPDGAAGTFDLVRFAIYCCAADAIPLRIRIAGATGPAPAADTWIEVTGRWRPAPPLAPGAFDPKVLPVLDLRSMRVIEAPANPYDSSV